MALLKQGLADQLESKQILPPQFPMANAAMGWDKACFKIDFDFFERIADSAIPGSRGP